jgi:hypothetical protein
VPLRRSRFQTRNAPIARSNAVVAAVLRSQSSHAIASDTARPVARSMKAQKPSGSVAEFISTHPYEAYRRVGEFVDGRSDWRRLSLSGPQAVRQATTTERQERSAGHTVHAGRRSRVVASRIPFANLPNPRTPHGHEGITAEHILQIVWLAPVVAPDGALQHASFVELREGKRAHQVRREPS